MWARAAGGSVAKRSAGSGGGIMRDATIPTPEPPRKPVNGYEMRSSSWANCGPSSASTRLHDQKHPATTSNPDSEDTERLP